jgi:hypothetical protein
VSSNVFLRRIHNHALGMEWLPKSVIPRLQWPKPNYKDERGITAQWEQLGGGMACVRKYDSREQGLEYILKCLSPTKEGANLYEVTKCSHSADEVMSSNSIWDPANLNRVSDTLATS